MSQSTNYQTVIGRWTHRLTRRPRKYVRQKSTIRTLHRASPRLEFSVDYAAHSFVLSFAALRRLRFAGNSGVHTAGPEIAACRRSGYTVSEQFELSFSRQIPLRPRARRTVALNTHEPSRRQSIDWKGSPGNPPHAIIGARSFALDKKSGRRAQHPGLLCTATFPSRLRRQEATEMSAVVADTFRQRPSGP